MYFIHEIQTDSKGQRRFLSKQERVSLAGCNNGIIIEELRNLLQAHHNPPCGWVIPLRDIYSAENMSVIIDIKPNNTGETVLCEIDKVFGYSYPDWTPIMFRLIQLYNDIADEDFNKRDFIYPDSVEIVYTMSYFSGSFQNGVLSGTWNWPGQSSTNSLMLYPAAMSFFCDQIKLHDPDFLSERAILLDNQP